MIRAMTLDDLPDVSWVTKAAFGGFTHRPAARRPPGRFPPFFVAADPGGCFIAVREQDATCVNGA